MRRVSSRVSKNKALRHTNVQQSQKPLKDKPHLLRRRAAPRMRTVAECLCPMEKMGRIAKTAMSG